MARTASLSRTARLVLCPDCSGHGVRALHGYDVTDMIHEDPDFAEGYMAGDYDTRCDTCMGDRVVPGCPECGEPLEDGVSTCYDHADDETREHLDALAEMHAEMAAEARMGC